MEINTFQEEKFRLLIGEQPEYVTMWSILIKVKPGNANAVHDVFEAFSSLVRGHKSYANLMNGYISVCFPYEYSPDLFIRRIIELGIGE